MCSSVVSSTTVGPPSKKRNPPWVGPGSSYRPSEDADPPGDLDRRAVARSVLAPTASVTVAPDAGGETAPHGLRIVQRLQVAAHPEAPRPASSTVESAALPPPMLSPTSISTTGPRGAAAARSASSGEAMAPTTSARRSQARSGQPARGVARPRDRRPTRRGSSCPSRPRRRTDSPPRRWRTAARGAPSTSSMPATRVRMGSSPVNCLTMLITTGGISSAWTGRISPRTVRTIISAHSAARGRGSRAGLVR